MSVQPAVGRHLYVVSGCSGGGKSTLLAALAQRGEAVSDEPGRHIVQEELRNGGDGLPWANAQRFVDLCVAKAIAEFDRHLRSPRRTFFDRSFVEVLAGVERGGLHAPEALLQAVASKRYAPQVFIAPPWQALFRPDAERRHTFAQAVAEYDVLVPAYRRLGYEVVLIPQASVAERVAFVLTTLARR